MKIYAAGPFFTAEERHHLEEMVKEIKKQFPNAEVFIPMEHFVPNGEFLTNDVWASKVFKMDYEALKSSDLVVALYLGHYSDTGTAWEIGAAYALGIHTYLYIPKEVRKKDMSIMPIQSANSFMKCGEEGIFVENLNQK